MKYDSNLGTGYRNKYEMGNCAKQEFRRLYRNQVTSRCKLAR